MWRGPLAYGQAGATRIFCGDVLSLRSFEDQPRVVDHTNGREARRGDACEQQQDGRRHEDA
jgi:hypothetical protein